MGTQTEANLVDSAEVILEDSSNAVFTAANILIEVRNAITEVSKYVPDRGEPFIWLTARNKSRAVDCRRTNILYDNNDGAAFPVLLKDTDGDLIDDRDKFFNKRNLTWGNHSFNMELLYAPSATVTDQATGTFTFTSGSTAISGSGTAFTTELRPGYYIQKSGSSEWYIIASISSDTALVLGRNVVSGDNGADTAGKTNYWRSDVILDCKRIHTSTSQTDLAGAVNAATADGAWSLVVKSLGTGTMAANTLFTIANISGVYRITSDATIAANVATLSIEPALQDRVPADAVVTFYPTTLTPQLERLVPQLAAARSALQWVGDSRTATDDATTFMASGDDLLNTIPVASGAEQDYLNYTAMKLGIARNYFSYASYYRRMRDDVIAELKGIQEVRVRHDYSRS